MKDEILRSIQRARWRDLIMLEDEDGNCFVTTPTLYRRATRQRELTNTFYSGDTFTDKEWEQKLKEDMAYVYVVIGINDDDGEHHVSEAEYDAARAKPMLTFAVGNYTATLTLGGRLSIGCQDRSLREWKDDAADVINDNIGSDKNPDELIDAVPDILALLRRKIRQARASSRG